MQFGQYKTHGIGLGSKERARKEDACTGLTTEYGDKEITFCFEKSDMGMHRNN